MESHAPDVNPVLALMRTSLLAPELASSLVQAHNAAMAITCAYKRGASQGRSALGVAGAPRTYLGGYSGTPRGSPQTRPLRSGYEAL